jgi:hypothetical protein
LIKDKQKNLEEMPRLKAMIKRVTKLRRAGLMACHYTKEFILRWIRPLGQWEKLTFECLQFADPTRNPSPGKNHYFYSFDLFLYCDLICLLHCLALPVEEVATAIKLMFDTTLTE